MAAEISRYISRIRGPDVCLEEKVRVVADIYRALDSRAGRALLRDRPDFAEIVRRKAEEFTTDLFKCHIDETREVETRALCLSTLNTVRRTLTRCHGTIFRPYNLRKTARVPQKLNL